MTTYHPQTGKFLAALATNIPREISGDVMQGWIDNPKALQKALRSALCPPTEKAERDTTATAKKVLRLASTAVLSERTGAFDPRQFFRTRKGLYVSDGFRDRVLAASKFVESLPVAEIASFDLVRDANDAKIRGELPGGHVFEDASAFCAYLAGMIERQEGGADGDLLDDGYANIFYVRGTTGVAFTVGVYWLSDARKWSVDATPHSDDRWHAGDRAFSRTC